MIRSRLLGGLGLLLAAALVIWPALFNGQPFFFNDTSAYIRGADAGIERLTGISTQWSVPQSIAPAAAAAQAPPPSADTAEGPPTNTSSITPTRLPDVVLAGRSIYYGILLYAGYVTGNFWLTALIQGAVLALISAMLLHSQGLLHPQQYSVSIILLCLTPASLFASFLMPDVFGGVTVAATSALLFSFVQPYRRNALLWFLLLTLALLMHSVNVIVCAAIWAIALLSCLTARWRPESLHGFALIPLAIVTALSGEAAFSAGVKHFLGDAPMRPPFLMARVIGDRTGEEYLRTHCSTSTLTVCRFVDRLPLSADEFLWLEDPKRGVFSISDPETRRALSEEQMRFVLATIANDPIGQLKASMANSYAQLIAIGASEFSYWDGDKPTFAAKLPRETWASMQQSRSFNGEFPVGALTTLSVVTTIAGTLYLIFRTIQSIAKRIPLSPSLRLALLMAAGVFANAVVCGSMSSPHDRYQARVIWLLPLAALLVDFHARRIWWNRILSAVGKNPAHPENS